LVQAAQREGKKVLTAAEWFGKEPLILRLKRETDNYRVGDAPALVDFLKV